MNTYIQYNTILNYCARCADRRSARTTPFSTTLTHLIPPRCNQPSQLTFDCLLSVATVADEHHKATTLDDLVDVASCLCLRLIVSL